MTIPHFPFQTFDWSKIVIEEHDGETGKAYWQIVQVGNIRVRLVRYSANYLADHWCSKGHIIHCIEGEMITNLKDGKKFSLQKGQSYIVGDDDSLHKTFSEAGCLLFIVD